jgi:hypothetical protein
MLIVFVIAGVSVAFLFIKDPEYIQIQSNDGIVVVSGNMRESDAVTINELENYSYLIEPSSGSLEEQITISFDVSLTDFKVPIAIFKFNEDLFMWEAISPMFDPLAGNISVDTLELGKFALRQYIMIDAPDLVSSFDEVLSMAPENTVGYELSVGFVSDDSSIIRISNKTQLGGCNGVVSRGSHEELSRVERTIRAFVDSIEREVEFVVIGRWFVDDLSGCDVSNELREVI